MSNLYNRLQELCDEKGVSGYRMCKDVGIQPSIMTDLKMGRRASMKVETAQLVTCSAKEKKKRPPRRVSASLNSVLHFSA